MTLLAILDSLGSAVRQLTWTLGNPRTVPNTRSLTNSGPFPNSRSISKAGSISGARTISRAGRKRAWSCTAIAEELRGGSTNDSARDGAPEVRAGRSVGWQSARRSGANIQKVI